ncbi:flagellar filament capping protein FliD [Naasia lichenicola]|uniref:Flagellar hook-associated protein 2 n=1 Tax=Naasia lichenicola TaxID=2565933 RepID=A0A4S4FK57_9MICO|nr:flagellar filament capping protein FliD [Naasia lichenicola]THG29665.1 hypothetical protein E6C64_13430 [Naasia lichenicola]
MAGLGIDGLASGLDSTSIITSLMNIEAKPQAALKTQLAKVTSFSSDLQALNTAVAAIATAATASAKSGALAGYAASSSSTTVTASAASTASPGEVSFTVGQLAKTQVNVGDAMSVWPDSPPVLTLVGADGTKTQINPASTSMADVTSAINAANAGVTATRVSAGTDGSGNALYRIQLRADESGAAGAFTAYRGDEGAVTAGTAVAFGAVVTAAQDAQITLWPGSSAQQVVTSSTNTFDDLMTGVDVTVTAVDTVNAVTVAVKPTTTNATTTTASMMASLTALFSGIATKTATTTAPNSSGGTSVTGGSFTGDQAVRQLKDAMLSAATAPVDGVSPSTIGITITRDGTITFDSAKLATALENDRVGTEAMLQSISGRIATAATSASDKSTGYLTTKITGQESAQKTLNEQISSWDLRLATRKSNLEKQYAALETSLSTLKSQSDYLASQLAGLQTSYTS